MDFLLRISRAIDSAQERLGKALSWLILAAVLVSSINAIIRFAFNASSNAWLELQWYLFSAVFLIGAGYTLLKNEHIKIDIVNSRLPKTWRDWIELFGHIFFLGSFCVVMIVLGIPFFLRSFAEKEYSSSAGGLILWPAKLMIPLGFAILLIQGISEFIKRVAIMQGKIPEPHEGARGHGVEG
ncbi:MAG TPA: TRAP transporter small permease subunit [Rhodoblastus sp.]|nr:TRAP transporter small permease subunit [Rhodoblastus sp.]